MAVVEDEVHEGKRRWVAVEERDHPWNILGQHHGLMEAGAGGKVDHMLTAEEVLAATGLDMTVKKYPVYIDQNFKDAANPTLIRTAKYYMTGYETADGDLVTYAPVSDKYEVVQPVETLSILDEVVRLVDGAHYSAGWNLPEKCQMGVTITLPETLKIGDDVSSLHILGVNSFDGSTSFTGLPIATQLSCTNQIPTMMRGARLNGFKFKHTKGVKARAGEARTLMARTQEYFKDVERVGNKLVEQKMTDAQFEKFLSKLAPFQERKDASDLQKNRITDLRTEALDAWRAEHNSHITGTAWGALAVVTEYAQWGRRVQGSPRTGTTPARQRAIGTMVHPSVQGLGRAALAILDSKAFGGTAA